MKAIREALTRKIGPLRAWHYLAIAAVGLLVWRHYHPSSASSTAGSTTASVAPAASDTGSFGYDTSGGGGGSGGGLAAGQSAGDTPGSSTTPVSWDPTQVQPPPPQITIEVPGTQPDATATGPGAPQTTTGGTTNGGGGAPGNARVSAGGSPFLSPQGRVVTSAPAGSKLVPVPPIAAKPGITTGPNLPIELPKGATLEKRIVGQGGQPGIIYKTASGATVEQVAGKSRYTVAAAPSRTTQASKAPIPHGA